MITITERDGCQGFSNNEMRILQRYLEDIYHYRLDVDYILYEFNCEGHTRYSFYVRMGNRFTRMFANKHILQPCASFNPKDGSITGKRGTKHCDVKTVEGIDYAADNYHPLYINHFVERVE